MQLATSRKNATSVLISEATVPAVWFPCRPYFQDPLPWKRKFGLLHVWKKSRKNTNLVVSIATTSYLPSFTLLPGKRKKKVKHENHRSWRLTTVLFSQCDAGRSVGCSTDWRRLPFTYQTVCTDQKKLKKRPKKKEKIRLSSQVVDFSLIFFHPYVGLSSAVTTVKMHDHVNICYLIDFFLTLCTSMHNFCIYDLMVRLHSCVQILSTHVLRIARSRMVGWLHGSPPPPRNLGSKLKLFWSFL